MRRELGLLLRQLTAHDAFVMRQTVRELTALALARVGRRVPASARAALRLHPGSQEAHDALACHAEARGDAVASARHRVASEKLAHNSLEISVLDALNTTFAWRRTERPRDSGASDLDALVDAGHYQKALALLDSSPSTPGSRLDALLRICEVAQAAGEETLAGDALEEALERDPGRADAWLLAGRRAARSGATENARSALERSLAIDPSNAAGWIALGDLLGSTDPAASRDAFLRALLLQPGDDAALARLEPPAETYAGGPDLPAAAGGLKLPAAGSGLKLSAAGERTRRLRKGLSARVEIDAVVEGGVAALWIVEPFGAGLLCEPAGRLALDPGTHRIALEVRAVRPDAVNRDRPWRLHLALCSGERIVRAHLDFEVPDEEPGEIHYVVTEDHELYDEREYTEAEAARTTLVDKSVLAEQLANAEGVSWTHMVDIGSLHLLPWAAARSSGSAWQALSDDAHAHLTDSVAAGNDLGLHCHAFHDPGTAVFCHDFDPDADRVTTPADFLEKTIPERSFWSRAFPYLGDASVEQSRAWATWRAIGTLEALGRLGDPRFRVAMFRAGSFDFGDDPAEKSRSLALLARLGVLSDSDVPKPRLYHRPMKNSVYPVSSDPRTAASSPETIRTLEVRPEYNVEADFLSDLDVLNAYVDHRVAELQRGDEIAPGVHIVCSMTHDKFINMRMGRQWDSLDPDYGDWTTIRGHLAHVASAHSRVRTSRVRDAVLAWWDRYTPRLLAWRDEEIVVIGTDSDEDDLYRYTIRLVGRDIPVSPDRARIVDVLPPAWLHGKIRSAWIERDGSRWPSRPLPVDPAPLEFRVDDRDACWELVVRAERGDGIRGEAEPGGLRLRSRHRYRAASVEIPAGLSAPAAGRRVRGVELLAAHATADYEALLPLD